MAPGTVVPAWTLDLEPLPITTPPLPGEVPNSYLWRLVQANDWDLYAVVSHLGQLASTVRNYSLRPERWHTGELVLNNAALNRLAVLSNYPASTLRRTLGSSNIHRRRTPREDIPTLHWSAVYDALPSAADTRLVHACLRCAAERGITTPATILRSIDNPACTRHSTWLIDDSAAGPINITGHDDLLAALRLHHNLRRRHPASELTKTVRVARDIWYRYRGNVKPEHYDAIQQRWTRRAAALAPDADTRWLAVRYPEIVALTSILSSTYWTAAAARIYIRPPLRTRPDFRDFLEEVARRIHHPDPARFLRASSSIGTWARRTHPTNSKPKFGYYTPKLPDSLTDQPA